MKTFEITFTRNNSGIYSANLCKAETAEQAKAYFQTLGNYEIIGVSETNTQPKPGQPVHTVPENWEAPEEQHPNIKEAAKHSGQKITYYYVAWSPLHGEATYTNCFNNISERSIYIANLGKTLSVHVWQNDYILQEGATER